jgi:hypothetical protein
MSKNVNNKVHEAHFYVQFAVALKQRWRVSELGVRRRIFVCMVEKVAGWKKLKNNQLTTCTCWGILWGLSAEGR